MNYRDEETESWLRRAEERGWEFRQVEFAKDRLRRTTHGDWVDEIVAFAKAAEGVVLAGVSDTPR